MISGSYDKRLCVYSFHERRLKYTLPSNKSSVTAICINSNASKMISCGLENNVLNVWQIVKDASSLGPDVRIDLFRGKWRLCFWSRLLRTIRCCVRL